MTKICKYNEIRVFVKQEKVSKIKIFGFIVFIVNLALAGATTGYYLYEDILNKDVSFFAPEHAIKESSLLNQVILGAVFIGIAIASIVLLGMLRYRAQKLGIISTFRSLLILSLLCNIVFLFIQISFFALCIIVYLKTTISQMADGIDIGNIIGGTFGKILEIINIIIDDYIQKYFLTFVVSLISFAVIASAFVSWLIGLGINKKPHVQGA